MAHKNIIRFASLILISSLFILLFLSQHTKKGTFHTDEPGVALTSISKNRNLYAIYKDVAYTSQPPLEAIVREKLYTPLGNSLNRIAQRFPELFHRSESLAWWILPIGFFFYFFSRYSSKNKYAIYLSLSLLASSDFFSFYLAEAKSTSAIGAAFAFIMIVLFQDKTPIRKRLKLFLLASALIPLLHLASFAYYLFLNLLVFAYLWVNSNKSEGEEILQKLAFWAIYMIFIIVMYLDIKKISSDYQHPSIRNIFDFSALNSYIKWTLDWAFYKTPLHFLFNLIPTAIKSNLLFILPVLSIPSLLKIIVNLFKKQESPHIINWLIVTIFTLWPFNIVLFRYFSGMFSGERYSIGIIVITFFLICYMVTATVWLKIKKNKFKHIMMAVFIFICFIFAVKSINFRFDLTTPEDLFVTQNRSLLSNPNNVIIIDNGSHVHSVSLLARVHKVPMNSEFHYCTFGEFYINNENILNEWIKTNISKNIYLFTAPRNFLTNDQIVWRDGNRILYKINGPIPQQELCPNPWNQKECYLSCLKGYPVSDDGRYVPDLVPHIDVYRK